MTDQTMTTTAAKVPTRAFARAATDTARVISRRSPWKALQSMQVDVGGGTAILRATDLEVTFETYLKGVTGDIVVYADGRLIRDAAKSVTGDALWIDADGDVVIVGNHRIPGTAADEWPRLATPDPSVKLGHVASELSELAKRFASTDDVRPILTGINFETDAAGDRVMVATDSYRLAVIGLNDPTTPAAGEVSALVPARAFDKRIVGDVPRVSADTGLGYAVIDGDAGRSIARIIPGTFPKWRQLMPDMARMSGSFTVDALELKAALKAAKSVAQDRIPVRFTDTGGALTLSVSQQGVGGWSQTIPASFDGDMMPEWAANVRYMTDTCGLWRTDARLRAVGSSVTVTFQDALKPVQVGLSDVPAFRALQMPVRL